MACITTRMHLFMAMAAALPSKWPRLDLGDKGNPSTKIMGEIGWNWCMAEPQFTNLNIPEFHKIHWGPTVPNLRFTAYNRAQLTTIDRGSFIHILETQKITAWSCLKLGRNLIWFMSENKLSHSLKFIRLSWDKLK
jgi:hypothetical protein